MSELVRFPKGNSRQIINYDKVISLAALPKTFLCLNQGMLHVMRYFLNTRGSWDTSYRVGYEGDIGYYKPSPEQMDVLANLIGEANFDMSNCSEINDSLQDIVGAIQGLQGQSGGCGCIADPGSNVEDFNDVPSQDIPGEGDPLPPGFATQEEYDEYRCNAAQWLYDNYTATLRNWAGLFGTLGGLTLAVISGLLLLTVPPIGLSLILAALGVLAGIDIGLLATLSDIAGFMDDNEEETVCNLYNAPTTSQAQSVLQEAAQVVIVDMGLGALQSTFEQITANLISIEQCEVLFNNSDLGGTVGDCTGCGPADLWTDGTLPNEAIVISGSFAGPTITLESVVNNLFGFNVQALDLFSIPNEANNRLRLVDVVTAGSGNWKYRYAITGVDQGETSGSNWADLETFDEECSYFILFSDDAGPGTPFTVTFNLEP